MKCLQSGRINLAVSHLVDDRKRRPHPFGAQTPNFQRANIRTISRNNKQNRIFPAKYPALPRAPASPARPNTQRPRAISHTKAPGASRFGMFPGVSYSVCLLMLSKLIGGGGEGYFTITLPEWVLPALSVTVYGCTPVESLSAGTSRVPSPPTVLSSVAPATL